MRTTLVSVAVIVAAIPKKTIGVVAALGRQ